MKLTFPLGIEALTPVTIAVKVMGVANCATAVLVPNIVDVGARSILCTKEYWLVKSFASPANIAVMLWVPTASGGAAKDAVPLLLRLATPRAVDPSLNEITPTGAVVHPVTVAAKVSGENLTAGFALGITSRFVACSITWMSG